MHDFISDITKNTDRGPATTAKPKRALKYSHKNETEEQALDAAAKILLGMPITHTGVLGFEF